MSGYVCPNCGLLASKADLDHACLLMGEAICIHCESKNLTPLVEAYKALREESKRQDFYREVDAKTMTNLAEKIQELVRENELLRQGVKGDSGHEPLVMWRCDGCGQSLSSDEVEPYGKDGFCHTVPVCFEEDEWEPQPCGPVERAET